MEQEKVKYLIDMINNMDIKDKLRFTSWGPYRIIRELNNYNISSHIMC